MDLTFSFNGISSSVYGIIGYPRVSLVPERRKNKAEISGRDGSFDFGNDSYYPRPITMECMIKANNKAARDTALAEAAVWLSGSGPLILGRSNTKQWMAKVYSSIDLELAARTGRFTVVFEADPPFAEDVDDVVGTIGTEQDYGSPLEFFPVVTLSMTGSAPSVQVCLLSTGEYVLVNDSLENGDELVFDMGAGNVLKNGVTCKDKVNIASLYFGVPPGLQTITVTTDGTYTVSITYKRRYLYA